MELVLRQYDYWLTVLKRTWRGSVFSYFFLPVLYLAAMGIGLGSYISTSTAQARLGGLSYLAFVGPGLLATMAMQTSISESTWPVMSMIKWQKVYQAMLATPLRIRDVLLAQFGFIAFRLAMTSAVFVAVMAAFGIVSSVAGGVGAVLAAVLVGMAYTTPTFAFSARLESDSGFALIYRLGVIPMFLFSGAFFPVSQMPAAIEWLAYLTPVWHGVELARMLTTGQLAWLPALGHLAYLGLWLGVGWWLAVKSFTKRLVF
jgi:lipooligosaccharide transport system permease protein